MYDTKWVHINDKESREYFQSLGNLTYAHTLKNNIDFHRIIKNSKEIPPSFKNPQQWKFCFKTLVNVIWYFAENLRLILHDTANVLVTHTVDKNASK